MTNSNKDKNVHWLREIFSDDKGRLSSCRIMAMIGVVAGCTALVAQAFGFGENADVGSLMFLFPAAYGSKFGQAYVDGKKN